jgi:large repetitive protein
LQGVHYLGNLNFIDFGFTLDRNAPLFPSFGLDPAFDTSPVGDSQTTAANVTLTGQTEASATVTLLVVGQTTGTSTTADAAGKFAIANVALNLGANAFTVEAKDIAGNLNTFATTVTRAEIPPEVIQLSVKPGEQLKIDSKKAFKNARAHQNRYKH